MCKACRQRSIWARIKLLSSISVAKPFDSASHSSRIKEENVSSLLQTWVPSFYQSFLENLSIFLVIFNQPDTHAYRFVDQFLKNISLRSCELTKLSILMINFVLSRAFEKLFFFVFPSFCSSAFAAARLGILPEIFLVVKTFVQNIFSTTRSRLLRSTEQRIAYFNPLSEFVKRNF